jgi:osmotically-inducible protein OsmY
MLHRKSIPDKTILRDVHRRLAKTGIGSRYQVVATVRGGQVTLTGQLQYANQRRPIVQAVSRVDGIRGVVDQITLIPPKAF